MKKEHIKNHARLPDVLGKNKYGSLTPMKISFCKSTRISSMKSCILDDPAFSKGYVLF